jgi:hypothetical protein
VEKEVNETLSEAAVAMVTSVTAEEGQLNNIR